MTKTGSVIITLEQDTPIMEPADTPEPSSKRFKLRNFVAQSEHQLNVRQYTLCTESVKI